MNMLSLVRFGQGHCTSPARLGLCPRTEFKSSLGEQMISRSASSGEKLASKCSTSPSRGLDSDGAGSAPAGITIS
jgi:hypothetical protein